MNGQIPLETQHKTVSNKPLEAFAFDLCCVPLTHPAKHPPTSGGRSQYAPRHSAGIDAGPEPIVRAWDRRIQPFNYPDVVLHAIAYPDWNVARSAESTYSGFGHLCISPWQMPNILRLRCPLVSTPATQAWRSGNGIVAEYQPARGSSMRQVWSGLTHQEPTKIAIYNLNCQLYDDPGRQPRPTVSFWGPSRLIETVYSRTAWQPIVPVVNAIPGPASYPAC